MIELNTRYIEHEMDEMQAVQCQAVLILIMQSVLRTLINTLSSSIRFDKTYLEREQGCELGRLDYPRQLKVAILLQTT